MTCAIRWNTLSIDEWEERFSRIPRSNILQSYGYARAHAPLARQKPRWGVIEIDGREAGLVQIFEAGILFNMIHAVILDRGPVWFDGFGNAMHVKRFFETFNREFPMRLGRRRRVLPEVADGPAARKMISQYGLTRLERDGYETYWLDLTQDEETLRANLKSNWRNKLNKPEKAGLGILWGGDKGHLSNMIGLYAADKSARGYNGPSPDFLHKYADVLARKGELYAAAATLDGDPIAFVFIASHGRSATYVAGWTTDAGRDTSAHHFLLWEAVKRLKDAGIRELDLGGINGETEGIRSFKEGMGGSHYRTVGHYS